MLGRNMLFPAERFLFKASLSPNSLMSFPKDQVIFVKISDVFRQEVRCVCLTSAEVRQSHRTKKKTERTKRQFRTHEMEIRTHEADNLNA